MTVNTTGINNDEFVTLFKSKHRNHIVSCENDGKHPWFFKVKERIFAYLRLYVWLLLIVLLFIYSIYIVHILVSTYNACTNESEKTIIWPTSVFNGQKVISCYYNTPNLEKSPQLLPLDIHPNLCTHINVAFAQIKGNVIYLDDEQYKSLSQVVLLKRVNPNLKILLSIGGAQDDTGFPDMVMNHASRKIFIKSVKNLLRMYGLDGIDLDWEFPSIHDDINIYKRERQHFSQLLRELRMEYIREKRDYLLTVATAAPETIVNIAYDIDQINLYVDYVNVMTYDFHAFSKYTPFTGLNSPLYHRNMEKLYLATLNINYTVQMYLNKGLDRHKIVVGIPTYGHSFTLVNANNAQVGSPASGYGTQGGLGFVNYPDICKFIADFKTEVVLELDTEAKVPYLHRGQEWISYDTPQSAIEKANYIKENNLGGAMIYSLNADDYAGVCDQKPKGSLKFPLAVSIKNVLLEKVKSDKKKY